MPELNLKNFVTGFVSALFLCFIFILSPQKVYAADDNSIFINEVMWQGASELIADEWLELYNSSDDIVDISGYYLTDETISPPKLLVTIPATNQSQIAPHGTFLISKNNKDFPYGKKASFSGKESYLDVEPDIVDSGLVLSNTNLQIGFYDQGQNRIDIFGGNKKTDGTYDFAPYKPDCLINLEEPATPENLGTYCSLQRLDTFSPGDSPASWENSSGEMILDPLIFSVSEKVFATPTPSGRPQISNFIMLDQSYKIGFAKSYSFSYLAQDSDADLRQVKLLANSADSSFTKILTYDQFNFDLPASSNCWNLSFLFEDEKNLSYEIDIPLKCYSSNDQIKFSEVLSAPKDHDWDGDGTPDPHDEWLELQNQSNQNYDLANWSLVGISSSGATKTAKISASILAGGFLVFYYKDTGVTMSNDGEKLYLYDPGGQLVDQVMVPSLDYNESYSKFEGGWKKTSLPTPGAENKLPEVLSSTLGSVASSSALAQISEASSEDQQVNVRSGVDSEVIVEQRIIHATLASYLVTNNTVLPKVDGAVMGSSDQRAQKPSKLSYNLLYFYFVLLGVVTVSTFYWGIYGIYRRE